MKKVSQTTADNVR